MSLQAERAGTASAEDVSHPTETLPLSVARHLIGHDIEVYDETVGSLSDGTRVMKLTAVAGEPPQELSTRFNVGPTGVDLEEARRAMQLAAWMLTQHQNGI